MSKREVLKTQLVKMGRTSGQSAANPYGRFDAIDGSHPWQDAVPEGYVLYPARKLKRGKVAYFNFHLAKEMGLLSDNHPHEMTSALHAKLLETFSIQIMNEYDQLHSARVPKEDMKKNPYMATRYLQLQHSNKQGKTSGDGRSIWNGSVQYRGRTWDVSSRGTGVTSLAPGAVEANRPLQTGAGEFGYGCGLADVDELYGSAIMSEIFHLQGIPTERVLVIIDLGKGVGIGVRAQLNLLRPAHIFLFLKQERYQPLKRGTDYFIQRQIDNGRWQFNPRSPDRYDLMLNEVCSSFAKFSAQLERNYIFAWMDWDGDNILADAGIIDYGSIRQFGLRHDQYRYDDVQRFSTNLNEQKNKARLTIQVFAQMVNYLNTKKRRPLVQFKNHKILKKFDEVFETHCRLYFLMQVGFNEKQSTTLLKTQPKKVEHLYQSFLILEKTKTKGRMQRVADGVNRPAVFKMRTVLRELPSMLMKLGSLRQAALLISEQDVLELMQSNFAKRYDMRLTNILKKNIQNFTQSYFDVVQSACSLTPAKTLLKEMNYRAQIENKEGRITGNGAEFVVDAILKARKRGLSDGEVQKAVELYFAYQVPTAKNRFNRARLVSLQSPIGQLFQSLINLSMEFEEEI